jgi:hypothetical protein
MGGGVRGYRGSSTSFHGVENKKSRFIIFFGVRNYHNDAPAHSKNVKNRRKIRKR